MRPTVSGGDRNSQTAGFAQDDDLIDCELCGEAHPGASDCPWELFAAGLGSDPRNARAAENVSPEDVEYRRSAQLGQHQRLPQTRVSSSRDDEPAQEDVTRLVERLDMIIRYGIPAIPDIVASAEDLVDRTSTTDTESAAEDIRCIAEDLLGLASTLPDVAGRLCRLADAMEKT